MGKDATRPSNKRADVKPVDGYVLTVDGKLKTRYETEKDAAAAGADLKQRFPVVQIAVYDAANNSHAPVDQES